MKNSFLILLLLSIVAAPLFAQKTVDKQERKAPPPPPPPSPKHDEHNCFFGSIREEMPRFPGCENQGLDNAELRKCAEEKMLDFVYSNLRWPSPDFCGEGMVVVSFVIEKDGKVTEPKVLRDIGGGAGEEAVRIVKLMPDWIPGKQHDRPVRVQYNLPVRFRQG